MGLEKFGQGPEELAGAFDILKHFGLLHNYDFFCKRPLPASVSDTYYLQGLVGESEIRKGEAMELGELIQNRPLLRETNIHIQPFDLDILRETFQLRDTRSVFLPSAERGTPKRESRDQEKKHRDKGKEQRKHKHGDKSQSKAKDMDKKKDNGGGNDDPGNDHSKRHHEKEKKEYR